MQKTLHWLIWFLVLSSNGFGQEPASASVPKIADFGIARLGLSVAKPDKDSTIHLTSLPPGIGFVVTEVEKDGPAERGGVRERDLLWKMSDQMLVNEAQLATLLRLSKPGDEVTLSLFRKGEALNLKLKLGEARGEDFRVELEALNGSAMRGELEVVRIVDTKERKAVFSNEKGSAEVYRTGAGDVVEIVDPEGRVIFEGVVRDCSELSMIPEDWRREICAMRRGLCHATGVKGSRRVPRSKIVPRSPTD